MDEIRDIPEATEVSNEPVDLNSYHPSLRHLLGNGVPLKTYRTPEGATVRIWDTCLPKTKEENERNIARMYEVSDAILERAAIRRAEEEERLKNKEAADSSHPVSDQ